MFLCTLMGRLIEKLLVVCSMSRARRILELAMNQRKTDLNCNDLKTDTETLIAASYNTIEEPLLQLKNESVVANFDPQKKLLTTS